MIWNCTRITDEFLIALIQGEIAQGGGDGTDDAVDLHAQQLDQHGQTLLLAYSRPDVDGRLPVTGGQVLNGSGSRFQRLRIGAVG